MIEKLAEMYVPTFGDWTRFVFLIGAWAVLFKTLYVATASNSRLTADFFSLAGFVRYDGATARRICIKWLCVLFPSIGLVLYLLVREPRLMVQIGGIFQAATLPVISGATVYLRYRRTDRRIAPSLLWDLFLWTALITISAVAGYAVWNFIAQQMGPAP
jgi:hypothetical protein